MSRLPELGIVRRFRELNALHLLSLQSELAWLEADFKNLCAEDTESECATTRLYQCDFRELEKSQGNGGGLQREALRELGGKLEAYSQ